MLPSPPKTPIYVPSNDVGDATIEKMTPEESRRSWLRLKFCQVYFLLVLIAVLVFAVLIFCIVFAAKFGSLAGKYESMMDQSKHLMGMNQGTMSQHQPFPGNESMGEMVPSRDEYDQFEGLPPAIKPSRVLYGRQNDQNNLTDGKLQLKDDPNLVLAVKRSQKLREKINQGTYIPPASKTRFLDKDPYRWFREGGACGRMDECPKSSHFFQVQRPLVVLSLDGFSKVYEQSGLIKNLDHIKECGTSAEFVIPSYPTKTFPNHYTIATGLYPGFHGLVDNYVYDPTLDPEVLDARYARNPELFQADPIWSLYKRTTGQKTGCMMWVGCNNHEGFEPDFNVPFNFNVSDAHKFDQVVDWLALPKGESPGLVMIYLAEPDDSGHSARMGEGDLRDQALKEIDSLLGYFLNKLHDKKLLDCMNLIVLSDHGMADLHTHVNLKNKLPNSKLKVITGPLARVHYAQSGLTQEDIERSFPCDDGTNYLLFNKSTMPPRDFYTEDPRTGDLIIEAPIGTEFRFDDATQRHGDHGYDYLEPTMRTVFFARGPSFQRKAVLRPFQNIEYYNLFAELLDIPSRVISPNNGTMGRLSSALIKQDNIQDPFYTTSPPIGECPRKLLQGESLKTCASCPLPNQKCPQKAKSSVISTNGEYCAKEYCNMTILERKSTNDLVIMEMATDYRNPNRCQYVRDDYSEICESTLNKVPLAIRNQDHQSTFSRMNGFFLEIWNDLDTLTNRYLSEGGPLLVISGSHSKDAHSGATHFFRILLSCGPGDNWNWTRRECVDATHSRILAFLFPHMSDDLNCMSAKNRLLKYTARVKDIESLTGLRFFQNTLPYSQMIQRTTHVPVELW